MRRDNVFKSRYRILFIVLSITLMNNPLRKRNFYPFLIERYFDSFTKLSGDLKIGPIIIPNSCKTINMATVKIAIPAVASKI